MRFIKKNRNKNFIALFFLLVIFSGIFLNTQIVSADDNGILAKAFSGFGDALKSGINWLLYGVFTAIGFLVSLAMVIFAWAINPGYVNMFFNNPGVYESWKFIRDFFNLFFILVLLYTAFTLVFQISKDFKKTLLSIVLAALFINFSYPVSRALIDVTNVPMYFFVNQMAQKEGGSVFGQALSASNIKGTLVPGAQDGGKFDSSIDISRMIMAIVFLFIFMSTVMVLAILLVIRLVVLVVLVIFSPVGFAASIIPGVGKYSSMWWDNFWKYAFFGPASMLMVLISLKLFSNLGEGSAIANSIGRVSGNMVTGGPDQTFFSSMVQFTIPVIMLWIAMGLGQKMSIAGANTVVGKGQMFTKWLGKKTYNNAYTRGTAKGITERAEKSDLLKFATPKYWKDASQQREERIAARIGGGKEGLQRVKEKQHNKKVAEAEKRMEEDRVSDAELRKTMNNNDADKAETEAAVRILSKRDKLKDGNDIKEASEAMKRANADFDPAVAQEKIAEITKKAGAEIYQSGQELSDAIGRLGDDTKAIAALIDKASGNALNLNAAQYNAIAKNPAMKAKLDSKLKKEGKTSSMINAQVASGVHPQTAINNLLNSMTPAELAKQDVFTDPAYKNYALDYMRGLEGGGSQEDAQRAIEIRKHLPKNIADFI